MFFKWRRGWDYSLSFVSLNFVRPAGRFTEPKLKKYKLLKISLYAMTLILKILNVAYTSFRPEPNHGFSSQPKLTKIFNFYGLISLV